MLERQVIDRACSLACAKTGKRIAASMAIMAITTSNSIKVKPDLRRRHVAIVSSLLAPIPRACFLFARPDRRVKCLLLLAGEARPAHEVGKHPSHQGYHQDDDRDDGPRAKFL